MRRKTRTKLLALYNTRSIYIYVLKKIKYTNKYEKHLLNLTTLRGFYRVLKSSSQNSLAYLHIRDDTSYILWSPRSLILFRYPSSAWSYTFHRRASHTDLPFLRYPPPPNHPTYSLISHALTNNLPRGKDVAFAD